MHGSAEKSAVWIPPAANVSRPILFSLGRVDMEVCLEKTSVYDGEPLVLNVSIVNQTNKNIKGMKVRLYIERIHFFLKNLLFNSQ